MVVSSRLLPTAVRELKNDEFADILPEEDNSSDSLYVSECLIESDLELLFPATYVPDSNQRILLYRELDSITGEADLARFRDRMRDRFGNKMPHEGEELIRTVSLRHKAKELGIEKVQLKGGRMVLQFVGSKSPFYGSDTFTRILINTNSSSFKCQMRESDDRCSITVEHIRNIETAIAFLDDLAKEPAAEIPYAQ